MKLACSTPDRQSLSTSKIRDFFLPAKPNLDSFTVKFLSYDN